MVSCTPVRPCNNVLDHNLIKAEAIEVHIAANTILCYCLRSFISNDAAENVQGAYV